MFFISLRDRSRNGKNRLRRAIGRQQELNAIEKTTATNILQDIRQEVLSVDGHKYSLQQIICSLTDTRGRKIFTGAERLGASGRVLLSFDEDIEDEAREIVDNIVDVLKGVIDVGDHDKLMDESKRESRETANRHRMALETYMNDIDEAWFSDGDSDGRISSLSGNSAASTNTNWSNTSDDTSQTATTATTTITCNHSWTGRSRRTTSSSTTKANAWKMPTQQQKHAGGTGAHTDQDTKKTPPTSTVQETLEKIREQMKGVKNEVDKEMEEARREREAFTLTLAELGGTIVKTQEQLSLQKREISEIRKNQETQMKILNDIQEQLWTQLGPRRQLQRDQTQDMATHERRLLNLLPANITATALTTQQTLDAATLSSALSSLTSLTGGQSSGNNDEKDQQPEPISNDSLPRGGDL